jgi:hypothetical protein
MHEESIRWPDGNIMALSVVVNVEEGSEMTVAGGDRGMEPHSATMATRAITGTGSRRAPRVSCAC